LRFPVDKLRRFSKHEFVGRNSPFYVRREAFQSKLFGKDIARKIISPTENFLAKVNPERLIWEGYCKKDYFSDREFSGKG